MYKLSIHRSVKKPFLLFVSILLLMVTVVTLSGMYTTNANDENSKMMREMHSWRNKIDEANRNNQILVQHEDTFKILKDKSVIGDENRLSWLEIVQRVTDSMGMTSVKYNITSQELLDKKLLDKKYKGLDVFKSVMSLDMKFLHEGDLFVMLNTLKKEAKGLVTVDKCDIELINKNIHQGVIDQNAADNMRAYCELSWYTLKKAEKS